MLYTKHYLLSLKFSFFFIHILIPLSALHSLQSFFILILTNPLFLFSVFFLFSYDYSTKRNKVKCLVVHEQGFITMAMGGDRGGGVFISLLSSLKIKHNNETRCCLRLSRLHPLSWQAASMARDGGASGRLPTGL